ncbi:hypothetical protein [Cupriavidus sp. CP313]
MDGQRLASSPKDRSEVLRNGYEVERHQDVDDFHAGVVLMHTMSGSGRGRYSLCRIEVAPHARRAIGNEIIQKKGIEVLRPMHIGSIGSAADLQVSWGSV